MAATGGHRKGIAILATTLFKNRIAPLPPQPLPLPLPLPLQPSVVFATPQQARRRAASSLVGGDDGVVRSEIITSHTEKWMQDTGKKSPMQLISEFPPIKVEGRIAACEGVPPGAVDKNPALGHPIEFICLDGDEPAICKYCGLRFFQDHGSHHH